MGLPKGTTRPDMIEIMPDSIEKYAKRSGISLNDVYRISGTSPYEVIRRGRASAKVIQKIASALRCRTEDLIALDNNTASIALGPTCNETEPCFARAKAGYCKALRDTYPTGKCPFRKERMSK